MTLNCGQTIFAGAVPSGFIPGWPDPLAGAVRYDVAQTLTANQMAQARSNIAVTKKNYIVNGAMMVSQENGTTAVTLAGTYPVDQFVINFSGHYWCLLLAQVPGLPQEDHLTDYALQ